MKKPKEELAFFGESRIVVVVSSVTVIDAD
jgi:hypothetical protein